MSELVSQEFNYEVDNEGSQARCYRAILPSEADSYALGERCLIQIPHTANGFLNTSNSWLNIRIAFSGLTGVGVADETTAIRLSNIGIYSAISQLNIISGSTGYVQEIRNFGEVMSLLLNSNTDISASMANSICAGIPPPDSTGNRLGQAQTIAGSAIAEQSFSIPLIGLLSGVKHLPIGFLNDNLEIEVIWSSSVRNILFSSTALATNSITGGTAIIKCEYDVDMIVVSDSTMTQVRQASDINNGILSWSDTQIHAVSNSVSAAELNAPTTIFKQTLVGGVKPKQLLQVFHTGFGTLGTGDPYSMYSYWSNQWRLRIGSQEYPPRFITSEAESFGSLQDCFNAIAISLHNGQADKITALGGARQPLATDTSIKTLTGVSGYNFTKFYDAEEGLDTTGKQLITEVNLITHTAPAVSSMNAMTFKRFAVVYSISASGQFSVSY